MRIAALAMTLLGAGCVSGSPTDVAYPQKSTEPNHGRINVVIENPTYDPRGHACTLVMVANNSGEVVRIRNWGGIPALEILDIWAWHFEDCPAGYDSATGTRVSG